jgi:outer membrane protein assembly factor BamB
MARQSTHRTTDVALGDLTPARSRHGGRRSAVVVTDDAVVAGIADGTLRAYERGTLAERWTTGSVSTDRSKTPIEGRTAVVSAVPFAGGIAVGERGPAGEIRVYDGTSAASRWRYVTARDVGDPQKETRFFLPFVVDLVAGEGRLYAIARRYERDSGTDGTARSFESCVYAFDRDGTIEWRYRTDASPISLDCRGSRVAVAFNRCPGGHRSGVLVFDADSGAIRSQWTPDLPATDDDRRVGDVSLLATGCVCTSHADYRGYRLDEDGEPLWHVDLATEQRVGDETLYAYPNHCHATDRGVVFLTGNTYARGKRETESRHPADHTAFGYALDGERRWSEPVGGFVPGIDADGGRIAVPSGQNFRTRDVGTHGFSVLDVRTGLVETVSTKGIVTAAAVDGRTVAAIEEPVVYHDEGVQRGSYRLHAGTIE